MAAEGLSIRKGRRGVGIAVDPTRVREAREARGLSLADIAGGVVSRAFIHQVESGRARPSMEVLEVIAERTGRSVAYFVGDAELPLPPPPDLSADLLTAAKRVQRLRERGAFDQVDAAALRMIETNLRSSAVVLSMLSREG